MGPTAPDRKRAVDRPEPPAQSAAWTHQPGPAVLTAQRGRPGSQGLLAERQRMVHFQSAAHTEELWEQQDLRKDRQTMGRAPPLGPASRPGTGANPGRNPGPAPQHPDRRISPFSGNLGRFPSNPGPWVKTPPGPP